MHIVHCTVCTMRIVHLQDKPDFAWDESGKEIY